MHGFWINIADHFLVVIVLILTFSLLLDYVPDSKFYKVEAIVRCSLFLENLLCSPFRACDRLCSFLGAFMPSEACMHL